MTGRPVLFVGRSTLDIIYYLEALPDEDTKAFAKGFIIDVGGPAANAAITHSLLGGDATLVTAIGGQPLAVKARSNFEAFNVRLIDIALSSEYQIPVSTILVNEINSTRTIINAPLSSSSLWRSGTSAELQIDRDLGAAPRLILSDGYFIEETVGLLVDCSKAGAAICLDGGSWKAGISQLASYLRAAICSERFSVPGQKNDPKSVLDWFSAQGVPHAAVTRGEKSILVLDEGRYFEIEIKSFDHASDTLGAGDILHGAFCYFFSLGIPFEMALLKASEIATLSCRFRGPRAWSRFYTP